MKRQATAILAALLAAGPAFLAGQALGQQAQPQPRQQQQAGQQQGKSQGQSSVYQAASKFKGMSIKNAQGKEVGSVDEVLVDAQRGQLAYVILTRGGIWGMGQEKYIVPWNALKQDPQGKGLTLEVPREKLRLAPPGEDIEKQLTLEMGREISQHYGVAPYWESSGQQQQQSQPQSQQQQQQQQQQQPSQPAQQPAQTQQPAQQPQ